MYCEIILNGERKMTNEKLSETLRPVIANLNHTDRETLKRYLTQIKYWVDTARDAHKDMVKNKLPMRKNYFEGFQESFLGVLTELNNWLGERSTAQITPRMLWPKEVPYLEGLGKGIRLGNSREHEIKIIRRAILDENKPLNTSRILAKMKEAEGRLGIKRKGKQPNLQNRPRKRGGKK